MASALTKEMEKWLIAKQEEQLAEFNKEFAQYKEDARERDSGIVTLEVEELEAEQTELISEEIIKKTKEWLARDEERISEWEAKEEAKLEETLKRRIARKRQKLSNSLGSRLSTLSNKIKKELLEQLEE